MNDLAGVPLPLILVVSVALILAASEVGHRLGTSTGDRVGNNLSTLEAAILGLLALMISFTFAMALSRFDARREAVLNEANAIGTTALRARLLPAPHNSQCLTLLREYVRVRLDITRRNPPAAELAAAINRSNEIQEMLWQQTKAVAADDKGLVPTGLFIEALNQMIDIQEQRLTAVRNRVPNIVILSLYGIAAVAMGFTGYAGALERRQWRPAVYITGMLVAAVILLIQDIDRPSTGFIRISQQPMLDVASSLAGYVD
jgi:hypothetical protein